MLSKKLILHLGLVFLLLAIGHSKAQKEDASFDDDAFLGDETDNLEVAPDNLNLQKYVPPVYQTPTVDQNAFLFLEFFEETKSIGKKWLKSESKKEGAEEAISKYNGEWQIGSPTDVILENDYGLIVRTKARHHAISSKLRKPFKFDGKPLVVQYEVKYEQGQECGGGYLKLLRDDASKELKEFNDKTPYVIMFGPDKCGMTSKVHLILQHRNPKNGTISEHHAKQPTKSLSNYFEDKKNHLYTLVIRPDNSFSVSVDRKEIMSGSLLSDLEPSIIPPKQVSDPEDKKPDEWDDRAQIEDPDAKKPEDWDESQPKEVEDTDAVKPEDWLEDEEPLVADPEAQKPTDWDDEMDGEWEARKVPNSNCKDRSGCGEWKKPMKPNPLYKGKWTTPKIKNPNYKGAWSARLIDNPAYFDADPYKQLEPIGAVGIELWTMSEQIVFDNIALADDEDIADDLARQTFDFKLEQEKLFLSASGDAKTFLRSAMDTLEEKPWLWVVIIFAVLIPVILIFVFCFNRKARPIHPKKTDEPLEDDEKIDNIGQEDEEEEGEMIDRRQDGRDNSSSSPSRSRSPAREKSVPIPDEQQEGPSVSKASPSQPTRRSRPRRQD
uniref:Calnexin n=1 Tax=Globodera rostochiensis TaxID=31243 RepID=A0A914GXN4_GLORO